MSDAEYAYYVVYAGRIAGEIRYGSQKVVSPVPFDNEEVIHEVAKQVKEQKHFLEVTIVNWKQLKG